MTNIILANIGSYPRIGEDKDQQRYRRGYLNFQNKEISSHAFKDVEQSVIQEIIKEQILTGLDEVTDGLICWQDPISHLCKNISGIHLNGYDRYFDTNFYFSRPIITKKPKLKAPQLFNELAFAKKVSAKPLRSVMTGPYTLAQHCSTRVKTFEKLTSRLSFFTDVITKEIQALTNEGATKIQIDEPSLTTNPADAALLKKSFEQFSKAAGSAKLILGLSFGPAADVLKHVATFPLAGLQLDFTFDGKKLFEKILTLPSNLDIGFGLINARSIKMDPIDPILNMIRTYIEKKSPTTCTITPSTGLEFLPRSVVIAKLGLMAKIKAELSAPHV